MTTTDLAAGFQGVNTVIYTAIFGGVDAAIEPAIAPPCDMVLFTDRPARSKHWQMRQWGEFRGALPSDVPGDPARLSRYFKLLPHRWFPDRDYAIWIDGSDELRGDPTRLLPFPQAATLFRHPSRRCVYDELNAIVRYNKDSRKAVERARKRYTGLRLPRNVGLAACSFLAYRLCAEQREFCERWWAEMLESGLKRDQPAWGYCNWRKPLNCRLLPGDHMKNEFVRRRAHAARLRSCE